MKKEVFSVGIDLGNGFTNFLSQRTGEGQRFATKVKQVAEFPFSENKRAEIHRVELDGQKYIVGEGVTVEIKDVKQRINSRDYRVALLTAIAKSLPRSGYAEVDVCVGLPIARLQMFADELESIIRSWDRVEFVVDGERYEIVINHVQVFAEGALSVIRDLSVGKVLTIDMGSGTVDCISFVDGEPHETFTVHTSMNDIYTNVADRLNTQLGMSITTDMVESYIGKEVVKYNREDVNISAHFEDIQAGVNSIYSQISSKFAPMGQYERVILLGGASILTFDYWSKLINGVELEDNAQYVNARIFQTMSEVA